LLISIYIEKQVGSAMIPFIYNELIDPAILSSLYENDHAFIQKIFQSFLDTGLDGDLQQVKSCLSSADTDGLRKVIHKIKPAFGFVGLTSIEEQCREMELLCVSGRSLNEFTEKTTDLVNAMMAGKKAIEDDLQKLILLNKT
jgi:HPt (histidine-containing phosphotransfer) domain-containing protein